MKRDPLKPRRPLAIWAKKRWFSGASARPLTFSLMAAVMLLSACGRENTIYQGKDPQAHPNAEGRALLPADLLDHSVNRARIDLALDGITADSRAIRLNTGRGSSLSGSYNGPGEGNRALLGISKYSGKALATLSTLSFDSKTYIGGETPSFLLMVDLGCDGADLRTLVASSEVLTTHATADGYSRHEASTSSAQWQASESAIVDPTDSTTELVPSVGSGSWVSLGNLLAKFPDACLRNVISSDATLPKNQTLSSILISLGSEQTVDERGVYVRRLSVDTDVYEGLK